MKIRNQTISFSYILKISLLTEIIGTGRNNRCDKNSVRTHLDSLRLKIQLNEHLIA